MRVHEYQAKELLERYGIDVPRGGIAATAAEAVSVAKGLGGAAWVVKAQIHAGGRGKGGGVRIARALSELEEISSRMLGMNLVTPQTGPEGRRVRKILVTEVCEIARELYASVVLDRGQQRPVLMVSAEGGVEIEDLAASAPEKIFKEAANPFTGLEPFQARRLARRLGLGGPLIASCSSLLVKLVRAFIETDASLVEVNPLALTKDGRLMALDAKLAFDDNALYRHGDFLPWRDLDEEDPLEVRASKFDLSYVKLSGDIGCMVNGAGLAMATLDIIQHCGGEPANFLDVGGGASAEKVTEAFKIIIEDPGVRAILVNIFGGIMRCDVIAEGILAAAREVDLRVPVVVRLEGTNVEEGRAILSGCGLSLRAAAGLADAARKAVDLARSSPE
ncbi:MAG: ADP-forming succinate--CoA ligase subunit beta [Planctomycetes bacterium]|nr:ADP-forming succinate--CoA ligase subunit beta [Planctomycetota bacterium]